MLSYIDWIIILIALIAMAGALLLFYLPTGDRAAQNALRELRLQAERDRRRIADVLEITQHGAQDAEDLISKLKEQVNESSRHYQTSQARIEQAERIIERVAAAEHEMRNISSQLGERLQHLQTYWDEQLSDSVENVKRIKSKLKEGLESVDESLLRLRDQEKMAQGFTRKLVEHHQGQVLNQQENARLSAEVHRRLEDMLQESNHLLEQIKRYQADAENVFHSFTQDMAGMESQANEQFTTLFQTTDQARAELDAGMAESRQHLHEMRLREAQSDELSRRILQQFEQIDNLRIGRISQTLDLTDQISNDLYQGMQNARAMLSTLERAVRDVSSTLTDNGKPATSPPPTTAVEPLSPSNVTELIPDTNKSGEAELLDILLTSSPTDSANLTDGELRRNLVSLRAYR